jgi:Mg-chelatase subunit ChlD
LAGLPKPVLFGLYGAVGGLLGALVFGEPLFRLLEPEKAPPPKPEPQIAVAASPEVAVPVGGNNTFEVQVARAAFDGDVKVRFEGLPPGVSAAPVTVAKDKATVSVTAASGARPATGSFKVIAEADADGKALKAEATASCNVIDPARPQADVFIVLDVTASMGWAIAGVQNGIRDFADKLARNKIDFRIGLVAFRDREVDPEWLEVLRFDGDPFTRDVEAFRERVLYLRAAGGGDVPESSLEAVEAAAKQPFRKGAAKVLLFITDAPPKVDRQRGVGEAVRDTAELIKSKNIDSVHIVTSDGKNGRPKLLDIYKPLLKAGVVKDSGEFFELDDVASGAGGFDRLIDTFGTRVAEVARSKNPEGKLDVGGEVKKPEIGGGSAVSTKAYEKGTGGRLALATAVWTAAIAALVCLLLLAGQHHYLRGTLPAAAGIAVGLAGGFAVGLVGGAAGQGLYLLAPNNDILVKCFRVVAWTLLGGLAGWGLSLFIPNLRQVHGLAGGAIGGAVGAVGFIAVSSAVGTDTEWVARVVGGLLLGFCIGLMVAIVEAAFRRAWLEVRYGERETITVNLGPEPVKVGGDGRACTIWARGAPPLAFRYFIRDGRVICEDAPSRSESVVGNGDVREVGNVRVTVRTGATAAPPAPPPVPRAATPPRPPAPKAAPMPLDDEDPFPVPVSRPAAPAEAAPLSLDADDLPEQVPPPRPAAPPVPAKGAKPPAPPAPKPAAPAPPAPARTSAPAGPRDPNACPTCGRVNPGRPGTRYCMMCDNTY